MTEPIRGTEQPGRKVNPWAALFKVLTEPAATFEALAERPAILPPYILQMLVSAGAAIAILPLSMAGAMEQLAKQPGGPAQMPQSFQTIATVTGVAGALAAPWITGLIVTLICLFFAQFQGGAARFGTYLSMVGYAHMPLVINGIIQSTLLLQARSLQQAQSMSISLAAFAPQGSNPYLRAFLGTINPFDILYYAFLAIGFAAIQKVKPARALPLVIALYLLTALYTVGVGGWSAARAGL